MVESQEEFRSSTSKDVKGVTNDAMVLNDKKSVQAYYTLGFMYENGLNMKQDYALAGECYKKAADQRHIKAQYSLGTMYESGQGLPKNLQEAVLQYDQAASRGFAKAQFKLGCMLAKGLGISKNEALAAQWFRRAAEKGHAEAQCKLAAILALEQDHKLRTESVNWYRLAANQGNAEAQFYLGTAYANAFGVEKDEIRADKWLKRAAKQGYTLNAVLSGRVRCSEDENTTGS